MVHIRPATVEDADGVAGLYMLSSEHHVELDPSFYHVPESNAVTRHYTELLKNKTDPVSAVLVAESDGDLVGMVEVHIVAKPSAHSMLRPQSLARAGIVVAPDQRRQGIGSALMTKAEEWAREHGATGMMLDMLPANASAMAFYQALGYEDQGALLLKRRLEP